MRPAIFCLTILVSLSACENSTDPFIGFDGGGAITAAQATGNWSFTVQRTDPVTCAGASLANGSVLLARLDVLSDGTLGATSNWRESPTGLVRPLSGAVTLSSGTTTLIMSGSGGSSSAMDLVGTMTAAGTFTGTLRDPRAGSFPVFGDCGYTATGGKTG